MSNDTNSGTLRENISSIILNEIDVDRKRFYDLTTAAAEKTIMHNNLFLEKNKRKQFEKKLEDIKENEDHSTKIKELNNKISELTKQLTKRADEIKGKEQQISDLEREASVLEQDTSDLKQKLNKLENQKPDTSLTQTMNLPPTTTNVNQANIMMLSDNIRDLKSEVMSMKTELQNEFKEKLKELQSQLTQVTTDMKNTLTTYFATSSSNQGEITTLNIPISKMQEQINKNTAVMTQLQQNVTTELSHIKEQINGIGVKNTELVNLLTKYKEQDLQTINIKPDIVSNRDELQAKIDALIDTLSKRGINNSDIHKLIKSLGDERIQVSAQITELQKVLENIMANVETQSPQSVPPPIDPVILGFLDSDINEGMREINNMINIKDSDQTKIPPTYINDPELITNLKNFIKNELGNLKSKISNQDTLADKLISDQKIMDKLLQDALKITLTNEDFQRIVNVQKKEILEKIQENNNKIGNVEKKIEELKQKQKTHDDDTTIEQHKEIMNNIINMLKDAINNKEHYTAEEIKNLVIDEFRTNIQKIEQLINGLSEDDNKQKNKLEIDLKIVTARLGEIEKLNPENETVIKKLKKTKIELQEKLDILKEKLTDSKNGNLRLNIELNKCLNETEQLINDNDKLQKELRDCRDNKPAPKLEQTNRVGKNIEPKPDPAPKLEQTNKVGQENLEPISKSKLEPKADSKPLVGEVDLSTLLIEPTTNDIGEWEKFKLQLKEQLNHQSLTLIELIRIINANLYYLEEAEELSDISLHVSQDKERSKEKQEENNRRKTERDNIRSNQIKIFNIQSDAKKEFAKRMGNQIEYTGRNSSYRKNKDLLNFKGQGGGVNTELYNNNADIPENIINLYENEKNIDIGRDLYENVVFTGGAIYKLPIGYTKQNQIINNLFKIINKSDKKIKIGGNRPSIIEKPLIGGTKLENLKHDSFNIQNKILQYKACLDGLIKYYSKLNKNIKEYDEYKTTLLNKKKYISQKELTIGEVKNYLSVMNSITGLWTSIDKWRDISHLKMSIVQKHIFNTIDEKMAGVYKDFLNSENENYEKEEEKIIIIRDALITNTNKHDGKTYVEIIEQFRDTENKDIVFEYTPIKTILNRNEFLTEEKAADNAKDKILEKFPHIDDEKRIDDIAKKLWSLYDIYYIMIQKWQNYAELVTSNEDISSTTSYKLVIPESSPPDRDLLKTHLIEFLLFRDILDEFQVLTRKPITLYARINDIGRRTLTPKQLKEKIKKQLEEKGTKENVAKQGFDTNRELCDLLDKKEIEKLKKKLSEFKEDEVDEEDLEFICSKLQKQDYIQWYEKDPELTGEPGFLTIDTSKCDVYNSIDEQSEPRNKIDKLVQKGTLKFKEVFWRPEFNDSKNISSYMLLDKLITRNIGTYLVTYGYSGVGKSFTLFGNNKKDNKREKHIPGLLQATVENVDNFNSLSLRVYELYGMGLGYSDCWRNYIDIDQSIYHYNIDKDFGSDLNKKSLKLRSDCEVIALKGEEIPEYIKKIHTYQKDETKNVFRAPCLNGSKQFIYFKKFPTDKNDRRRILNNLTNFIDEITESRKNPTSKFPKRVNATVNNQESSRSKLVYDFMFELNDKNTCPLVIDDTPGAENLIESYITKNIDINFYDKLQKGNDNWKFNLDSDEIWQYSVLNATLVNPLFAGVVNSAGILTAFNRIISGEKLNHNKKPYAIINEHLLKEMKLKEIDFDAHKNRVKRMQNLFEMFYNEIKDKRVTVNGPTFKNYVHNNNGEIIFQVIKTGNSYSKICSNIHEQKLFTKFFESRNISISQRGKLNNILNNEFQVKPQFKDSTPNLESKTMHLAVWLILNLIKFCSKRTISGKTQEEQPLENNEMKYDMLIELLAYSCDLTDIFTRKYQKFYTKRTPKEKWDLLLKENTQSREFQEGLLAKIDGIWKDELKIAFEKVWKNKLKDNNNFKKSKRGKLGNEYEKWKKFQWENIQNKIPTPEELRDDLFNEENNKPYPHYWIKQREDDFDYALYIKPLIKENKQNQWETFLINYETNKEIYKKIYLTKDKNFNTELPFKARKFLTAFKNKLTMVIDNFAVLPFTSPIYRYYAKEDFKKYITLAMESWYIDQNISGILKKCSEISGLNYETIIGDITPWQYYNENEGKIYKFAEKAKNEREVVNYDYTEAWDKDEALKQYGVIDEDELKEFDTQENNQVSLGSYLRDIEELINKLTDDQSLKIVDADLYSIYKQDNINTIKFIQKRYNMTKLFPIKKFPTPIKEGYFDINDYNKTVAKKYLEDFEITNDKENQVKKWSKEKIDTIIGVLMNPYINKPDDSEINIQDYKMFYVLSNNDTQLKCWDQLKTFNMFAKFISKMPK